MFSYIIMVLLYYVNEVAFIIYREILFISIIYLLLTYNFNIYVLFTIIIISTEI